MAELYDERDEVKQRGPYFHKVQEVSHLEATEKPLTLRHMDIAENVIYALRKSVGGEVVILG